MSSSHSQLPHVSTSRISASQLLHQSPPTGHRSPPAAAVQQPPWAASGSCVTSLDVQQHLSPSPTYSHRSRFWIRGNRSSSWDDTEFPTQLKYGF
ncbi:hypothetical protein ACS0TY_022047 [Phlomoides rotata]